MSLAARDRHLLEALRTYLGTGSIVDAPARNERWLPTSTFRINSHVAHRRVTIPFADAYLLPSNKRDQFVRWRQAFDEYERLHPNRYGRGPSTCSEPGCDRAVRGRGVCRVHYYRITGY